MSFVRAAGGVLGQQGGGGGAFAPTDIAGCTCWLDAADAATISDTAGAVNAWTDKSSLAASYEDDRAVPPQTGARTINSLNAIDFDGSEGLQSATTVQLCSASDGTFTSFAVAEFDTVAGIQMVWAQDPGTGSPRMPQFIRANGTANDTVRITGSVVTDASGVTLSTATPYVMCSVNSASGARVEIYTAGSSNGATVGSGTNGTAAQLAFVGCFRVSVTSPLNGGIGEIVHYDSVLSASDINTVANYLATKWGASWADI